MIIFRTLLKQRFSTQPSLLNLSFRDGFENESDDDIDILDSPKEDVKAV